MTSNTAWDAIMMTRRGEAFACLGMNACMQVIANASPLHRAAKQCYYWWDFSKN